MPIPLYETSDVPNISQLSTFFGIFVKKGQVQEKTLCSADTSPDRTADAVYKQF
jgi:hypothetical protein